MGHEKLQSGHYENVREEAIAANGRVLFIQDGSELIYNSHPWTTGLGHTADASGNGIMFHSCLAVKIENEQPHVIGLACRKAWIRTDEKRDESSRAGGNRQRQHPSPDRGPSDKQSSVDYMS